MANAIIACLRAQLEEGQDSPLPRFGLGSALFKAQAYREAAGHLRLCSEQMPDHSAAWKLLGRSHMALGESGLAGVILERGLDVAQPPGGQAGGAGGRYIPAEAG